MRALLGTASQFCELSDTQVNLPHLPFDFGLKLVVSKMNVNYGGGLFLISEVTL